MERYDLHCHTTLSDGSMYLPMVLSYAKRIGLTGLAITDHDTLAGIETAKEIASAIGLKLIPGVEISTRDRSRGRTVHLLCYYPKRPQQLQEFLNKTLKSREESKLKMVYKLTKLYPVTPEHILYYSSHSESIYESHIMQALADLGYTNTVIGDLMSKLISPGGSCYVQNNSYPDTYQALEEIKKAGGIAAVAHPGQFDSLELTEDAARQGLIQAVEYDHPRNSPEVRGQIEAIAGKYGLILTGGSDFHGQYSKAPHPLGFCGCGKLTIDQLEQLSAKLEP